MGRHRKRKAPEGGYKFGSKRITKLILCSKCSEMEVEVDSEVQSVVCWRCCSKMVSYTPPTATTKQKTGFPRGWKLYGEFVTQDGTVYHKGVEQPKLKGTIPPTKIAEKPKLSKHERMRLKEERQMKKEARLAKQYKKKMKAKKVNEA